MNNLIQFIRQFFSSLLEMSSPSRLRVYVKFSNELNWTFSFSDEWKSVTRNIDTAEHGSNAAIYRKNNFQLCYFFSYLVAISNFFQKHPSGVTQNIDTWSAFIFIFRRMKKFAHSMLECFTILGFPVSCVSIFWATTSNEFQLSRLLNVDGRDSVIFMCSTFIFNIEKARFSLTEK